MNEGTCPSTASVTAQRDLLKCQSLSRRTLIQILEDKTADKQNVKPSHSNEGAARELGRNGREWEAITLVHMYEVPPPRCQALY